MGYSTNVLPDVLRDIPTFEQLMGNLLKTIKVAWNIENKIHHSSIERWLGNFTGEALSKENASEKDKSQATDRERQLALFLLCNFVYYNENEIKHLARLMFKKYIHNYCIAEGRDTFSEQDIYALLKESEFSYLGEPSESSSYLLYLFRQENELARDLFSESHEPNNIVFIDDFSITGSQAVRCLKKKMKSIGNSKKYYVLLMVATEDALAALEELDGVTIIPCIVLSEEAKAFSNESIIFAGYNDDVKNDARKMCEHYGELIKTSEENMSALGFGGSGYLFGSYYNVPNNTLPIFWSSLCDWVSLFKRHDKQYFNSNINWGGHYV